MVSPASDDGQCSTRQASKDNLYSFSVGGNSDSGLNGWVRPVLVVAGTWSVSGLADMPEPSDTQNRLALTRLENRNGIMFFRDIFPSPTPLQAARDLI